METKKELIEYIYSMHLQNNTERIDFDRAFKYGIECAIDELIELKKLREADVSGRSEQLVCTFCGINPMTEICKHPKVCSTKEKLKQTNCH
jgi:hypothetical protein